MNINNIGDKAILNLIRKNARKLGYWQDIDIDELETRLKVRKKEILDFAHYCIDKGELALIEETLQLINAVKEKENEQA